MTEASDEGVTRDAILGGRLQLLQPARGHRVGHDAILLAAAVAATRGAVAVDLGAGVGAAGLALARRVDGVRVTLVEIDPVLAALAARNIADNGLSERASAVALDARAPARSYAAAGLVQESADWVLSNPPFYAAGEQQGSPDAGRRAAHLAPAGLLAGWTAAAQRLLRPAGRLVLIYRAAGLPEVLDALAGFGGLTILPIHPKPGSAAIRILVGATKGSRAPLTMLPALTLTDGEGRPSAEAEGILRAAQPLPLLFRRRVEFLDIR